MHHEIDSQSPHTVLRCSPVSTCRDHTAASPLPGGAAAGPAPVATASTAAYRAGNNRANDRQLLSAAAQQGKSMQNSCCPIEKDICAVHVLMWPLLGAWIAPHTRLSNWLMLAGDPSSCPIPSHHTTPSTIPQPPHPALLLQRVTCATSTVLLIRPCKRLRQVENNQHLQSACSWHWEQAVPG